MTLGFKTALPVFAFLSTLLSCAGIQKNSGSNRMPAAVDLSVVRPGFVTFGNLDPQKRTVCAITLNSDNEILTFQKHLSQKDFQFVELVNKPFGWLQEAVDAQISCDILVVSGHFGGTFFGDRGRLALEELERASCSSKGAGIFHNVQEVFLFGCNTLAGKDADHRTPEEYIEVLIRDGFTRAQAEQTAAFRYSPLGGTFHSRMSQVFAGVPRIYGFTSVGPSGKTVQPYLNKYLAKKDYAKYLSRVDRKDNKEFLSILKVSAVVQTSGVQNAQNEPIPRCIFSSPEVPEKVKLDLADRFLMDPKQRFLHMSEVGQYLLKNPRGGGNRTYEMRLQRRWVGDAALKKDFLKVFGSGLQKYPSLRLDLLDFGQYLGWLDPADVDKVRDEVLGHVFRDGLTPTENEYLMSMAETGGRFVTYHMVKDYFEGSLVPQRMDLISVMHFLKPQDRRVQEALVRTMKTASDEWERYSTAAMFGSIEGLSLNRQLDLMDVMQADPSEDVRTIAAWALENVRAGDPRIREALLQVLNKDNSAMVRRQVLGTLVAIHVIDDEIKSLLKSLADQDPDAKVREKAEELLRRSK